MGEKKLGMPLYLSKGQVRELFNVTWGDKTFQRKMQEQGFPFMKDGKTITHPTQKTIDWFKRREK